MKRSFLIAASFIALAVVIFASSPTVFAARHSTAAPTASPVPSALPTATPEPPSIAIPRLQAALKANPNDQQAMGELATQYLQINRPDLSVPLTQHLLQIGDKTAQVYYYDGAGMLGLGNVQAATADYETAANLDPTNLGVLAQLTSIYVQEKRFNDAERVAKRAVTFNKTESQAYLNLGVVYANESHFDDARAQFQEASTLDPKSPQPFIQIANTYRAQNNIPAALQAVNQALLIDPKNVQILVYKADVYAQQKDDTNASQAYDDAVVAATTDDDKVAILTRKAGYFVGQKKTAQAEGILKQTIATYPANPAAYEAYGDYLASQNQVQKAIQQWQTALTYNKDYPPALLRMGQTSLASNRPRDAIAFFKHYTQVSPDAQGFALLGQAYSFLHDYKNAKDSCTKSFNVQRSPDTLGCVAGADFELKNYKESAQIFDTLGKAVPKWLNANPQMLYVAAKSYEQTKQNAKAIAAYKKLLPMMKKGTKEYAQVQSSISTLSKLPPGKKT